MRIRYGKVRILFPTKALATPSFSIYTCNGPYKFIPIQPTPSVSVIPIASTLMLTLTQKFGVARAKTLAYNIKVTRIHTHTHIMLIVIYGYNTSSGF